MIKSLLKFNVPKLTRYKYSTIIHYDNDPTEKWRHSTKKESIDYGLWIANLKGTSMKDIDSLVGSKFAKFFSGLQDFDPKLFAKYGPDFAASIFVLKLGGAIKFLGNRSWHVSRINKKRLKTLKSGEKEDLTNLSMNEAKKPDDAHTISNGIKSKNVNSQQDFSNILLSRYSDLDPEYSNSYTNTLNIPQEEQLQSPSFQRPLKVTGSLEWVDLSKCHIMYRGLSNLQGLDGLKGLTFANCPHFNDYCLAKLPIILNSNTLQFLDISSCPKLTERGLATLHYLLPGLRLLVAKNLEGIPNHDRPLIQSLIKNMLPRCKVVFE